MSRIVPVRQSCMPYFLCLYIVLNLTTQDHSYVIYVDEYPVK